MYNYKIGDKLVCKKAQPDIVPVGYIVIVEYVGKDCIKYEAGIWPYRSFYWDFVKYPDDFKLVSKE